MLAPLARTISIILLQAGGYLEEVMLQCERRPGGHVWRKPSVREWLGAAGANAYTANTCLYACRSHTRWRHAGENAHQSR